MLSFALVQAMTVATLPIFQEEVGATQAAANWVLIAQLLAAAVATPIVGRVGDMTSKKRMLVLSLTVLTAGTLAATFATSLGMLIAARVLQGLGGGTIPLTFGIIRDVLPKRRRAAAISAVSSISALGISLGIVIAGPLSAAIGFHLTCVVPGLIAGSAAVAAAILLPISPPVRSPARLSALPAFLLPGWLVCLLIAVSQGPTWGWSSVKIIILLGCALILCFGWVRAELGAAAPIVDLTMMRARPVWAANLVALLAGVLLYVSFGFVPQFVQTPVSSGYGFGASATQTGLVMLPATFAIFTMAFLAAPLRKRFGAKAMVVFGCLLCSAGTLLISLAHREIWIVAMCNGISSLGIGLVFALLANLIVAAVEPEHTGSAGGINANFRIVGGAVATATATSILSAHVLPFGAPAENGYTLTFLVLSAIGVAAAIAALLIPRSKSNRLKDG